MGFEIPIHLSENHASTSSAIKDEFPENVLHLLDIKICSSETPFYKINLGTFPELIFLCKTLGGIITRQSLNLNPLYGFQLINPLEIPGFLLHV